MHPISSPSIEYSYFNQLGSLACQTINCNRPQHFNWLKKKKKPGWKRASGSGLRWKALLKVNLTLNCFFGFFCTRAERGSERSWQRRGEKDRRRASTSHAAGWHAEESQARRIDGTARAGNRSLAHTEGTKIECIHTGSTTEEVYTHRHTHTQRKQVIRLLTAAKVGEAAAQKSASQQLILPMWSLQRQREWRRLENSSASAKTKRLLTDQYICHSTWAHS